MDGKLASLVEQSRWDCWGEIQLQVNQKCMDNMVAYLPMFLTLTFTRNKIYKMNIMLY